MLRTKTRWQPRYFYGERLFCICEVFFRGVGRQKEPLTAAFKAWMDCRCSDRVVIMAKVEWREVGWGVMGFACMGFLWRGRTGCSKRESRLRDGKGLLGWLKWPDSLTAADAQGSRLCQSVCACMHIGSMLVCACLTVCVRGRCGGFPSVLNEVLHSQQEATKRDDGETRGGIYLKRRKEGQNDSLFRCFCIPSLRWWFDSICSFLPTER